MLGSALSPEEKKRILGGIVGSKSTMRFRPKYDDSPFFPLPWRYFEGVFSVDFFFFFFEKEEYGDMWKNGRLASY